MVKFVLPYQAHFDCRYISEVLNDKVIINNFAGPSGGTAIDKNVNHSFLKAISEALDRRSSMIWFGNEELVSCVNLIDFTNCCIPKSSFALSDDRECRDTTGGASHLIGEISVINAVVEILQKMSLAYIWYSKKCYRYSYRGNIFLVNCDFYPLYTVLFCYDDKIRNSFGMGTSIKLNEACEKAFEECVLLLYEDANYLYLNSNVNRLSFKMGNAEQLNYYNNICLESNEFNLDGNLNEETITSLTLLIDILKRKDITKVYCSLVPNDKLKDFKVVRIYSPQLVGCLPKKEMLLKNSNMLDILELSREEVNKLPSVPNL